MRTETPSSFYKVAKERDNAPLIGYAGSNLAPFPLSCLVSLSFLPTLALRKCMYDKSERICLGTNPCFFYGRLWTR